MRTYRLLMPAVTLAGALALTGCGGGSDSGGGTPSSQTVELAKGAYWGDATRRYTCNKDGGCTITLVNGKIQGTEAELIAAGIVITEPENPRTCGTGTVNGPNNTCVPGTAKADTAKALKGALAKGSATALETVTATTAMLDANRGAADDSSVAEIPLKKQDAMVAALGDWTGADYKGDDPDKNTGMARLYSNQEAGELVSFAEGSGLAAGSGPAAGTYTGMIAANVAGFPEVGKETYENEDEVQGTYRGVSGTYTCTDSNGCTSVPVSEGGFTLSNDDNDWTFKPVAGATIRKTAGADYLYFGWWVRKDKDDEPTHIQAVYGKAGSGSIPAQTTKGIIEGATLIGEATYTGKAAGKFAVSDPLDAAKDDSGHFTANAMLKADFGSGAGKSTLEGTIDGFRLNDGTTDPGWTVDLRETAAFNTNTWDGSANKSRTVWHLGDNAKGDPAGRWEADMYDPPAGSSNNTPSHVVGSFHSAIGGTHEMRGAFGAELD